MLAEQGRPAGFRVHLSERPGLQGGHVPDATAAPASPDPQERIQALEQWARGGSDVDPLTHALVIPTRRSGRGPRSC